MALTITSHNSDESVIKKVIEISGENFYHCFQCGTCSGSCPMTDHMNAFPRTVMALLQLGAKEALERTNTAWICASCHTCVVRCPRSIDIAKVMEAIRLLVLRQNLDCVHPNKLPAEEIAEMPQIALVSGFRKMTG